MLRVSNYSNKTMKNKPIMLSKSNKTKNNENPNLKKPFNKLPKLNHPLNLKPESYLKSNSI